MRSCGAPMAVVSTAVRTRVRSELRFAELSNSPRGNEGVDVLGLASTSGFRRPGSGAGDRAAILQEEIMVRESPECLLWRPKAFIPPGTGASPVDGRAQVLEVTASASSAKGCFRGWPAVGNHVVIRGVRDAARGSPHMAAASSNIDGGLRRPDPECIGARKVLCLSRGHWLGERRRHRNPSSW